MAKEASLEHRIKRYAESKGCLFWKFVSPGTTGVPDRVIISPRGATAFLEIKAPGCRPRAIQDHRMQQLRAQGVAATWVSDYRVAVGFIDSLCTPKR